MKDLSYVNIPELFESIDKHTSFKEDIVVWLGLRASDYNSISFLYPDAIASTRYGKDSINIEKKYKLVSTEKNTKVRTDSDIEELAPYVNELFKSFDNNETYLVCYHSSRFLENLVKNYPNVHILNSPAYLKSLLDKKRYVRKQLQSRDVRIIPGIEGIISADNLDDVAKKFKFPFFVQFDNSASGSGSYKVNNSSDFNDLIHNYKNTKATFMKFIEGKSLNINAVQTNNFTILGEPSLQIIGAPELTSRQFGYCGNDFNISSKISEEELKQIFDITYKVGKWIGELGYRGMFGVDFISNGEEVYFTEINPRFQGSTSLLIDRQNELGKIPLSFFHLVPFLDGLTIEPNLVRDYNEDQSPLNVSQLLLHNTSGRDLILDYSINPGRYLFEDDNLIYQGPAQYLSDTKSYDEILIAGDVPVHGTRVLRDSDEICRIYTYKEVLDKDGKTLNNFAKKLINKINQSFKYKSQ
ncbi:MAG: ATP-grasp domain-containing protein [Candidatus Pacearchaeota archaeon]